MSNTPLSISIVNYNCADETLKAVKSILELTQGVDFMLYVVDNASDDGGLARLRAIDDDRLVVIYSKENVGYGRGHNIALARSESEFHAVVNPDIVLHEDSLSILCDWLRERPDAVMVTCRLQFVDGSEQYTPKRSPTPISLVSRQLGILPEVEKHYLMLDEDLATEQEISFCTGCFFVTRTKALKAVGGFCSKYFLYFEDADLTRMMMKKGKVYYTPITMVEHLWQRKPRKNLYHFRLQLFAMIRYFVRWGVKRTT